MDNEFNAGDIVFSKKGRDSGRYYIVMRVEDNYAYICDGDLHKTEKPKKKKLKHLKHTACSSEHIKDGLSEGRMFQNAELRRAIAEFRAQNAENSPD